MDSFVRSVQTRCKVQNMDKWTLAISSQCYALNYPFSWRRGIVVSGVHCMNEVNARRAWLVPGWVTVFGRVYHLGM